MEGSRKGTPCRGGGQHEKKPIDLGDLILLVGNLIKNSVFLRLTYFEEISDV